MKKATIFLALSSIVTLHPVHARTFQAEGSDSLAGVGARYVGMGGTGVASSKDVYAAYYNPAGLAEISRVETTVSRQLNAELRLINFIGVAVPVPLKSEWGVRATVAGVFFPRMHAHSTGAFHEDEVENVFLRYLLPGIPGSFDGEIDSKTKVYRLAMGFTGEDSSRWSAGINIDRIDCETNFCGVHATSNGYTVTSTGAKAIAYGFGFRFRPTPELTLGGAISDVDTRLKVNVLTTDNAGTRQTRHTVAFPRKTLLGASYQATPTVLTSLDYEIFAGKYGDNDLNIQIVRWGLETQHSKAVISRIGLLAPTRIESSKLKSISPPAPVSPSLGVGYRTPHWSIDLAVYVHPLMSLHKNGIAPAADLSLSAGF